MYNPRWPFKLSAFKESLDENGLPVTDENGDPAPVAATFSVAVYDSRWNPIKAADGSFKTTTTTELPWGYRTSTGGIKDSGEVFATDFKISCPMMFTHLEEGERLSLTDATHTFYAVVKKMTTYNWGTNIWLERVGNNGELPSAE